MKAPMWIFSKSLFRLDKSLLERLPRGVLLVGFESERLLVEC